MSFGIYMLGFLILLGGLVYGAALLHVPNHWIAVMVIILAGAGIVKGVTATRSKDPSA